MWTKLLLCMLLATLYLTAHAYPKNQKKIPNGENVPNPCNLSTIWPGVGHQNVYGSGPRNPFGLDFAENDHVWDKTLCEKDSDGDGKTNGQELGDPNCIWTVNGSIPLPGNITISHPGVCEPLDSPVCLVKNSWLKNCGKKTLNCPAINEPGVLNYTLRIPVTSIPTKETTYICHSFVLPWESVADIIAFEPIIDNAIMLHHMTLLATTDEPTDHPVGESYECTMESTIACRSVIGAWGVGIEGMCLNSQVGFRMGPTDFRYAIIQFHWNNPELKASQTDSSGMRIYYTRNLRPNRGQIASVGQAYISIPPGQPEVAVTGSCSGLCTTQLSQSIYLTSSFLHMHTLGRSGVVSLRSNGNTIKVLDNITSYSYDTPRMTEFEAPVEMKPGYEIEVKCVYNSTKRNTTTKYGEATYDEMCYDFIAYYPLVEGLGFCGQISSIPICPSKYKIGVGPCEISKTRELIKKLFPPLYDLLF